MAYTFKKMVAAFAVPLVAATALVGAHFDGNMYYDGSNGGCPCPCPCPDYDNCCASGADFWVEFDALVFKVCEDGLAYGTQTRTTPPIGTGTPTVVESRVKSPHFRWDWGFRLGLGYNLPCDCWGIAVYWTHIHAHTRSRNREGFTPFTGPGTPTAFFTPAWGFVGYNTDGDPTGIDLTRAHWKMRLDMLDVELGRPFCVSQCLTIRPHIGVRAVWLNQRYRIENFVVDVPTLGTETLVQEVRLKSDYEAVGLRGGLDTQWDLGCGMSLYGSAAASVVYGNFDLRSRDRYRTTATVTFFEFDVEQKHNVCACRAITDAGIGLRWRTCLCGDSMAVTLQIGWEHHLFINKNMFEDFTALNDDPAFNPELGEVKNPAFPKGDLCLKGVTFSARFDF